VSPAGHLTRLYLEMAGGGVITPLRGILLSVLEMCNLFDNPRCNRWVSYDFLLLVRLDLP
jgi:hypothetical protein